MSVEKQLDYFFFDKTFLQHALIRRSYAEENQQNEHQEAYGTLGRSLLQTVLTEMLIREGLSDNDAIAYRLNDLMQESRLAKVGVDLAIDFFVKLGSSEKQQKAHEQPTVMAETLTALLGAVYFDGGFRAAREVILKLYSQLD